MHSFIHIYMQTNFFLIFIFTHTHIQNVLNCVIRLFKVQTSPVDVKLDLESEILARHSEAAKMLSIKRMNEDEERTNLLPSKQDRS